jgi:hypothetical protein
MRSTSLSRGWDSLVNASVDGAMNLVRGAPPMRPDLQITRAELLEEVRRNMMAAALPPVDAIVVSAEGEVWLRQTIMGSDTATWLVLNERGDIIARTRIPAAWDVKAVGGDAIHSVSTGPYDTPVLIRARIRRTN